MPYKPKTFKQRQGIDRRRNDQRYDQKRRDDPAKKARSTALYQRFRKYFLINNPLCRPCQERGRITATQEVHHVRTLRIHPEDLRDADQCMPVCRACHAYEEGREL